MNNWFFPLASIVLIVLRWVGITDSGIFSPLSCRYQAQCSDTGWDLMALNSAAQLAGSFTRQSAFTRKWRGTLATSSQRSKNFCGSCDAGQVRPSHRICVFRPSTWARSLFFCGAVVYPIGRWTSQHRRSSKQVEVQPLFRMMAHNETGWKHLSVLIDIYR